jgi:hypothetical protein
MAKPTNSMVLVFFYLAILFSGLFNIGIGLNNFDFLNLGVGIICLILFWKLRKNFLVTLYDLYLSRVSLK